MDYTLVGHPMERTLSLRGAPMRWRTEAGQYDIYVPALRVAGTETAVRAWLHANGHPASVIAEAFRNGDQTSERFKEAVKAAAPPRVLVPKPPKVPTPRAVRPPTVKRNPQGALERIRLFNAQGAVNRDAISLSNRRQEEKTSPRKTLLQRKSAAAVLQPVPTSSSEGDISEPVVEPTVELPTPAPVAVTRPPTRNLEALIKRLDRLSERAPAAPAAPASGDTPDSDTTLAKIIAKHTQALRKRIAQLPEQKVLDVSEYEPETGRGAKTIGRPGARDFTRIVAPNLAIASRTQEKLDEVLALLA